MRKTKTDKMREALANEKPLEIPAEEIWTYRIEGLQAPRIVDKSVKAKTKLGIIVFLVIAISLSIFFSIRAVSNEEFDFKELEKGYEFVKYSNPGGVTEVTVDFVDGDEAKPVTEIHEYAFNCDEKVKTINIGKSVEKIDGKSFYSCWNLENVFVDDENEYYTDLDGVLYTKDLSEVIYYPSAHNLYLTREAGYPFTLPENGSITNDDFCNAVKLLARCVENNEDVTALTGDDAALLKKFDTLTGVKDYKKFVKDYNEKVGIYILPAAVEKIGKLAFAYSDITEIYIPEGVKEIGTLGFFKAEKLKEIYSYKTENAPAVPESPKGLEAYKSLPAGLEFIGSDAFTYDRALTYMFVPSSVKEIGHHAFYNMAFKSGDTIEGVAQLHVELSEDEFKDNTKIGENFLPKVDAGLFEKSVEVVYAAER